MEEEKPQKLRWFLLEGERLLENRERRILMLQDEVLGDLRTELKQCLARETLLRKRLENCMGRRKDLEERLMSEAESKMLFKRFKNYSMEHSVLERKEDELCAELKSIGGDITNLIQDIGSRIRAGGS